MDLGGFDTMLSFLGSIGTLMSGSGLDDLLADVYAEHSVNVWKSSYKVPAI